MSNQTKHTAGPWQLNTAVDDDGMLDAESHERYVLSADAVLIADCYADTALDFGLPESFSQAQANARLIAASPDLLDAVMQVLRASEDNGDMNDIDWNLLREAARKAGAL